MIVELWIRQLIEGNKQFKDVPKLLKKPVKETLIKQGLPHLVVEKGA